MQTNQKVFFLLKSLLISYVLTGLCLLLIALLLYRFQLSKIVVNAGITITYGVSTFVLGLLTGKKMQKQKFLWGLFMGSGYFLVLVAVSLLVNQSIQNTGIHFFTTLGICAGCGMLGGMVS